MLFGAYIHLADDAMSDEQKESTVKKSFEIAEAKFSKDFASKVVMAHNEWVKKANAARTTKT